MNKKNLYAVILNYGSGTTDCLNLANCPDDEFDYYIENTLGYSLSNCEWMIVTEEPILNFL